MRPKMILAPKGLIAAIAAAISGAAAPGVGTVAMPSIRGNPGFAPTSGPSGVRAARRMAAKHCNRLRANGQHQRAVR